MAKLLDRITKTIKKLGEENKDFISETGAPKGDIGTGNGLSPTTGEKTYNGTSTNYGTYEDDLNRLSEAKKKTQIAQLKQARDKALANLDVQEQTIKPAYQNARNQASATSQSGARSFAEYLANRGLTNSGASAQGEINRLSALQNTLGGIDTAEANAYRDIANQRTAIQNDYVAGVANANNAIAQEYYNNMLNYNQQQRAMVDQLNQQALLQYSGDYQARINELLARGYSPNSLEILRLQALRANKINDFNNGTYRDNALAQIMAGNINYNTARYAGFNSVEEAKQYYLDTITSQRQATEREIAQQAFENRIKEQQLANDTAQTNYNINKPYYKPTSGNNNGYVSYGTHKGIIDNNFITGNEWDSVTGNTIPVYDIQAIKNYLESENLNGRLSDNDALSLLAYYGISY